MDEYLLKKLMIFLIQIKIRLRIKNPKKKISPAAPFIGENFEEVLVWRAAFGASRAPQKSLFCCRV